MNKSSKTRLDYERILLFKHWFFFLREEKEIKIQKKNKRKEIENKTKLSMRFWSFFFLDRRQNKAEKNKRFLYRNENIFNRDLVLDGCLSLLELF